MLKSNFRPHNYAQTLYSICLFESWIQVFQLNYAAFFWLNSFIFNKLELKFQWWWLTVRLTRLFMKMSRNSSMSRILNMLSWYCSSLWDWNSASSVETVGTKSIVVIQFEVCDRICLKWVLFIFEETKQIIIFQI